MSDDGREPVRVTIFGEEYTIRSEMDPDYTRECARHVDDAIQSAHVQSHVTEPHKAAILAALEITDELFRTRSERDRLQGQVSDRITSLRRQVAEALEGD